ncbi:hypothetical protein Tco_1249825 [Tanacetum coccineum]
MQGVAVLLQNQYIELGKLLFIYGSECEELAVASILDDTFNFYQTVDPNVAKLFHINYNGKPPSLVLLKNDAEKVTNHGMENALEDMVASSDSLCVAAIFIIIMQLDMINQCFLGDSCEEILSSLERLAIEYYSKQGDKQSIVREPVSVDESGSELALDKLAIKAIIYIFRQSNIHPERSHKIVERDVEEHGDVKELKKAALQLSVIRPSKIWTKLSTRRVN